MAENAAHITSSLQVKPSIFEVIAQDSLGDLLYPSFKTITQTTFCEFSRAVAKTPHFYSYDENIIGEPVVKFLEFSNPQRYQWLNTWYEEAFLGINGVLQLYYLNKKEASFSESFYGLKRELVDGNGDNLSHKAKYWSLFCLVILPYLVHKADYYATQRQRHKGGKLVALTHKSALTSWHTLCLVQYLLYLTGRAEAHSPLLRVANLSLHYRAEQPDFQYTWAECFSNRRVFGQLLQNSATQVLELAAFFLQALQWWHSDEHAHEKLASHKPPAPPPVLDSDRSTASVCPVCKELCKIETALLTSGYVFCYRCIRDAIFTKQQCPITGLPTSLDELVRLYPTK